MCRRQDQKQAFVIPIRLGLVGQNGEVLPCQLAGQAAQNEYLYVLTQAQASIELVGVPSGAIVSALRDFSAPVQLQTTYTTEQLTTLMLHDIDPFNRWEASQRLALSVLLPSIQNSLSAEVIAERQAQLIQAFGQILQDPQLDNAFKELMLNLPSYAYLAEQLEVIDPQAIVLAREALKKAISLASGMKISTSFSGSFLDIDDKIDMALIRINPSTLIREFQYINISKYKMWNFSTMNQFKKGNWNLNFGAALVGISQKIENQIFASNEKFLYSFNINSNISYFVPKWQTTFSAYYKYNGKTQQFVEGNSEYIISTIDASHWLDASIRKSFFKNQLEATIGARNILNITNINQTRANDGAAHGISSNIMLAYGRSYFLKLTYNLNF